MGADWYYFTSVTAAAIPVPKEALQSSFDLPGFKLMTVQRELYNEELNTVSNEYHGAMICLAETDLPSTCLEVIGPYEIQDYFAVCKRIKHLDAFMPAGTRDGLISAFEKYVGRKPDVMPGFWIVSATSERLLDLHTTWSLAKEARIVDGKSDCFDDGSDT